MIIDLYDINHITVGTFYSVDEVRMVDGSYQFFSDGLPIFLLENCYYKIR